MFGPEDNFFNRFARMSQLSPVLPLIGGGRTRFQPVYVGDVADAVVAALGRPETAGRTYELGGPAIYSFKELLAYLLRVTGRRRLLVNLPFGLASLQAKLLQFLPEPPLTPDQVVMLERDNVVSAGAAGLARAGLAADPARGHRAPVPQDLCPARGAIAGGLVCLAGKQVGQRLTIARLRCRRRRTWRAACSVRRWSAMAPGG